MTPSCGGSGAGGSGAGGGHGSGAGGSGAGGSGAGGGSGHGSSGIGIFSRHSAAAAASNPTPMMAMPTPNAPRQPQHDCSGGHCWATRVVSCSHSTISCSHSAVSCLVSASCCTSVSCWTVTCRGCSSGHGVCAGWIGSSATGACAGCVQGCSTGAAGGGQTGNCGGGVATGGATDGTVGGAVGGTGDGAGFGAGFGGAGGAPAGVVQVGGVFEGGTGALHTSAGGVWAGCVVSAGGWPVTVGGADGHGASASGGVQPLAGSGGVSGSSRSHTLEQHSSNLS